jgi:hypothetical protein
MSDKVVIGRVTVQPGAESAKEQPIGNPSPWPWVEDEGCPENWWEHANINDANGTRVAAVISPRFPGGDLEANTALILAAPETKDKLDRLLVLFLACAQCVMDDCAGCENEAGRAEFLKLAEKVTG